LIVRSVRVSHEPCPPRIRLAARTPGLFTQVCAPYPDAIRSTIAAPWRARRPAGFSSANGTDYSALAAAATFTTLPLMVYFLLLQRQFIRGAPSAAGSTR